MKVIESHKVPAIKENIRLQEYAVSIFETITSKSGIKKAIKREEILIDGRIAQTSDYVQKDQIIELLASEPLPKKVFKLKLDVLFEDEYLAVINKPSGYSTSGNFFKTIVNALPYNLKPSEEKDTLPFPSPVHRLDNPTSGLLIIAKTRQAQMKLHQAFENKIIQKIYLAIIHGKIAEEVEIHSEIEGKTSFSRVIKLKEIHKNGVIYSIVEVHPETGRTHQIRIHLSQNGNPIVGDQQYGLGEEENKHLLLAATGVKFTHPITEEFLEFNLPAPKGFRNFESFLY